MKKYFLFILSSSIFFSSCTEDLDVKLPSSDKKVVIEGHIENGKLAEVIITRNIPLFSSTAGATVNDFYVTNAEVYVSDGSIMDTLHLVIDSASALGLIYRGSTIIGIPGQTYFLTVKADGQTFSSITTIPSPVVLDSVYWKTEQGVGDTLGYAWAHFNEPSGLGNNYRFLSKLPSNRRYLAPYGATWDDKYVDGKAFDFAYGRAYDPTDGTNNDLESDDFYYKPTDTIYIKFCAIDRASKDFYVTFENALSNNGNPFASPVTVLTNITGGALGVWSGWGATYDTIMP